MKLDVDLFFFINFPYQGTQLVQWKIPAKYRMNELVNQFCKKKNSADDNNRGGNSPRFSIRKIFQFNPELGQKCSEITNKMFKRIKHP